jgi:hypothetical protein
VTLRALNKGAEMDSSLDTPHQEAEQHTPTKLSGVVHDEDPELVALWVAAQKVTRIETRIAELRLISQDTQADDLRGAIDNAIEECELRLVEPLPQSLPPAAT